MKLPTKPTAPKKAFTDFTSLIYGAPKIGKSTLASQFEKPLFLATEAGLNSLETYNVPVNTWQEFLETCGAIAGTKHDFKTIVIDTIDNLYMMCAAHICAQNGIRHESDLDWGKGWTLVREEFKRAIVKLTNLPYGVLFISHAEMITKKTNIDTVTVIQPTMPAPAQKIILPLCDFIFYAGFDNEDKRHLYTKPTDNFVAGDRTGKFAPIIDLSYEAIKKEFDK